MKTAILPSTRISRGFSLIEVLVCIALIGIIASLAIPMMNSQSEYQKARDRRNAQELASICAAAQAAGLDFVVPDDLQATIANIVRGGTPDHGAFKGRVFSTKGLGVDEMQNAATYLKLENGVLIYKAYSLVTSRIPNLSERIV